ncbi:hypothetical protein [Gordonia sp. NPDC003376]
MGIALRRLPIVLLAGVGLAGTVVGCGSADTTTTGSSVPVVVVTETHTETVGAAPTPATSPTSTSPRADTVAYAGEWVGHTRSMTLSAGGTGTMSVFSGAANGEQWTLTWGISGGGVDMTLVNRTSVVGDGVSGSMHAGATYHGVLTADAAGVTYMTMTGFGNEGYAVTWCNQDRYGYSPECGA